MNRRQLSLLALAATLLAGCSSVQPWEKSTLAKATMKPLGSAVEVAKIDLTIYPYREQVKGGTGIGGAGCGCN